MLDVNRLNAAHHNGFRISTQGVLQQSGQLGIPVWNMRAFAVDQRRDDIPQS